MKINTFIFVKEVNLLDCYISYKCDTIVVYLKSKPIMFRPIKAIIRGL
jgi:hypothetical protein